MKSGTVNGKICKSYSMLCILSDDQQSHQSQEIRNLTEERPLISRSLISRSFNDLSILVALTARKSEGHQYKGKPAGDILPPDVGKVRQHISKKSREVSGEPLAVIESESKLPRSRPSSDATDLRRSFGLHLLGGCYDTGDPVEDARLKKLDYAALEIFTVEKAFLDNLELIAIAYPNFIAQYGKERGVDILAKSPNGQDHIIKQIASQLVLIMEAHKFLLEKFEAKIANWDSRNPNMAECLKNNAGFLKYCQPYLKEKKRFVDELTKQLQENDLLAQATAKFEEQARNKLTMEQRLDVVHQNVVRYTILLEAYKKYLVPGSVEAKDCEDAIVEVSKVSEAVNHQICLAEMEKRLFDLYRRLEGKFNVLQANRHLLHEGELMKQSRKELQPRYLILFSDVLLICKYSRAPSLGAASFHPDFYQLPVIGISVEKDEHGENETHFLLLSAKKSFIFIAESKHMRDDWVKRLNDAKTAAKKLRDTHGRRSKGNGQQRDPTEVSPVEPSSAPVHKAPWVADAKATACMVPGCLTRFSILNRRHHCRQCGILICFYCVGYAPVKDGANYIRDKVCPACFNSISAEWEDKKIGTVFTPPPGGDRAKSSLSDKNDEEAASGTVFVRKKGAVESEKYGRLVRHEDGVIVLKLFNAEFDAQPYERHVLLGFELRESELEEGGRLFELQHTNQILSTAISISFRVVHSGSAEKWSNALREGLSTLKSEAKNTEDTEAVMEKTF